VANFQGTSGDDVIAGTAGADTIDGSGGDDDLNGNGGDDFITDFDGANHVLGGLGNDTIWLGSTVAAFAGNVADAGDGDDSFMYQGDGGTLTSLDGGGGADFFHLRAEGGTFSLTLGSGVDRVYFSSFFNKDLDTQFAITDFAAGAGGDRLEFADFILDAGSGWDGTTNPFATGHVRLVQSGADTLVEIDKDGGGDGFQLLVTLEGVTAAALTADNLDDFPSDGSPAAAADFTGTEDPDMLRGTNGANKIDGLGGDDNLYGLAGDDELDGGAGFDNIDGGGGNDVIRGGDGDSDWLFGGQGDDELHAGDSGALMHGDAGDDLLVGSDAGNSFTGGVGLDTIVGGAGFDLIAVEDADIVDGGGADDQVTLDFRFLDSGISVDLTAMWAGGTGTLGAAGSIESVEVIEYFFGSEHDDVFVAGAGLTADLTNVAGYGGDDQLEGGSGGDNIGGGEDDDLLRGHSGTDTLSGENGNDRLEGGDDADLLDGGEGDDEVVGGEGADQLFGFYGDDELWGEGGNDKLQGGPGTDTLHGGDGDDELTSTPGAFATMNGDAGDDLFLVDTAVDVDGGTGNDLLSINFAQVAEALDMDFTDMWNGGVGRIGAGEIRSIEGFLGAIVGSSLDDSIVVGEGMVEGAGVAAGMGADFVIGGSGQDSISGQSGDDTLFGGAGNDFVFGSQGVDWMAGGLGDDTFDVFEDGDTVVENVDEGTDTIVTGRASYTLAANVEILTGLGTINQTFFGNALANTIDGGIGADIMRGGLGDDTYIVDNAGDRTLELAAQGTDTVRSAIQHTLLANVENLVLTGSASVNAAGNALDNVIDGNSGGNLINGLAGADTMRGAGGSDTYIVDNAGDQVIEASAGGGSADTVQSSVTFTLGNNIERLYLTGTGNIDAFGNVLANAINGNNGANRLDGGAGADVMRGGFGNDTYVVETPGDLALESSPSGGIDTVESSIALTLLANVENLVLTGSANINGAGNALANSLTGNSGNNLLNGFAGADTMSGGDGDDVYIVDNAGDQAIETNAAGGTDRVQSSVGFALGDNVENLTLTGSAGIDGTGNALNNAITGNGAANALSGGDGHDTLLGGAGADVLRGGTGGDILNGGTGADSFVFDTALDGTTNRDGITGYSVAADTIVLDSAVFAGLAAGPLAAGAFHIGSAAADADDRIIYNAATGVLLFDPDGVGGAAALEFASIGPALAMSASEFTVI